MWWKDKLYYESNMSDKSRFYWGYIKEIKYFI